MAHQNRTDEHPESQSFETVKQPIMDQGWEFRVPNVTY